VAVHHRGVIDVRPGFLDDGPVLQEIERRAGERFRHVGMPEVADDAPPSLPELAAHIEDGRCFVAVADDGGPVGYVLCASVDGEAHVTQVSVLPERQGEGVGRALLDAVERWAVSRSMPALSLTTFADVPWNRPLYEHLGFRVLADDELGTGLRAVRDEEAERGLDPAARVCMRRPVAAR
jgi:GNAT superfamily N-acetyltransferase